MNVLYICPNGYLGGAERFVIEVNGAHVAKGKINTSILFFGDGMAVDMARKFGVKTYVLPFAFRYRKLLTLLKTVLYIRKLIRENQIDIVHSTMPYSQILAVLSTLFLKTKKVWFQHGPVGGMLDKIANLFPTDLILFNSEYLQDEHNKMINLYSKDCQKRINYGIAYRNSDQQLVKQIRQKYLDSENQILVTTAGRICPWKGYETLIEAVSQLEMAQLKFLKILIVGDVGRESDLPYKDYLYQMVKDRELGEVITFVDYQKDLFNYLHGSDVFIHTSRIPEPFGLVVAEAMLQDTLVVGSNSGGVTDILQHRKTGLSFDTISDRAPENLRKILEELIETKLAGGDFYSKEISCAKDLISGKYSIAQMVDSVENHYSQLTSCSS